MMTMWRRKRRRRRRIEAEEATATLERRSDIVAGSVVSVHLCFCCISEKIIQELIFWVVWFFFFFGAFSKL